MTHPRIRPLGATLAPLVLTLALAACGPLAAEDVARVDYRPDATYPVPAGTALVVEDARPIEEVGLTRREVNAAGLTWIPQGIRGDSANAAGFTVLVDVEAPEGWEVRLWEARIVRERPLGERGTAPEHRLRTEVRVDVPAAAEGLTRRVRGTVRIDGGEDVPLDFLVRAE